MKKPNILIFMTDQQRGDTVPPYSRAITPNLDKFYQEAVTFTRTYCPAPHCCPSRATFFTGLYPTEHGVWNNVDVGNTLSKGLYDGIHLFSDDLKEEGYRLYFSGKWHVSAGETPVDRGWEMTSKPKNSFEFDGNYFSLHPHTREWNIYKERAKHTEPKIREEAAIIRPGYGTYKHYGENENPFKDQDVIDDAIQIIRSREKTDQPWCQYIGPLGPHDPYFVPKRFLDMYDINDIKLPDNFDDVMKDKPNLYRRTRDRFDQLTEDEHKQAIRHYLAFCSYEDYLFGQVLRALEESGEMDDTLILYISDHGDYMAEHGLWCKGLPCFRPAYHIPAIIRWPDGVCNPGRTVDALVSLADFAPTFLDVAGVKTDREFTGSSLVPFLRDEQPMHWRDAIFTQTNGNELYGIQRSVMTDKWKYVYNGFDYDELYDLENDPNETNNLATDPQYQEIIRELCKRIWKFAYEHKDTCINQYIMVALAPYGPAEAFR